MTQADIEQEVTDLSESSYKPIHEVGVRYHCPLGGVWQYVEIVFCAYPERASQYQWIPINGIACGRQYNDTN